jgi:hypothetical protein
LCRQPSRGCEPRECPARNMTGTHFGNGITGSGPECGGVLKLRRIFLSAMETSYTVSRSCMEQ